MTVNRNLHSALADTEKMLTQDLNHTLVCAELARQAGFSNTYGALLGILKLEIDLSLESCNRLGVCGQSKPKFPKGPAARR